MKIIIIFIIAMIVFLMFDFLWLGFIAKDMYQKELPNISSNFKMIPAFIFYFIYIVALIYFVIHPNIDEANYFSLIVGSIIFGLVCYATYDLTNYATLEGFPLKIVIIDLIWGMFVTTVVAVTTKFIMSFINI